MRAISAAFAVGLICIMCNAGRAVAQAPAAPATFPATLPAATPATPAATEPDMPAATLPAAEPVATEPVATEPAATEPAATAPAATEPSATAPGNLDLAKVARLYLIVRRADAGSDELKSSAAALRRMLHECSPSERIAMAASMLDGRSGDHVNLLALDVLGADWWDIAELRKIMFQHRRQPAQALLLTTLYSTLGTTGGIAGTRSGEQMIDLLASRLEDLTALVKEERPGQLDEELSYLQQRLLINLCIPALRVVAGSDSARDAAGAAAASAPGRETAKSCERLIAAMKAYRAAKSGGVLSLSIASWLDLRDSFLQAKLRKQAPIDNMDDAVGALAHWDELIRLKAAAYLARRLEASDAILQQVMTQLEDSRDEVRAAAATSLAFARLSKEQAQAVVGKMIDLLTQDRGVLVQAAAAEALGARAADAAVAIDPLLNVFERLRPGPRRTSHILMTLSRLAGAAGDQQRHRMVKLATAELNDSPRAALELLKALGPQARGAVEDVRQYRATADRLERQFINHHVLPAILYSCQPATVSSQPATAGSQPD